MHGQCLLNGALGVGDQALLAIAFQANMIAPSPLAKSMRRCKFLIWRFSVGLAALEKYLPGQSAKGLM